MNMQAIPTEYAGIRFRSKSEAIFASFLQSIGISWEYEPTTSSKHPWDFYACSLSSCYDTPQKLLSDALIEYKPSRPTATYVENLKKQMPRGPKKHIVFGSPWTPASKESVYAVMYNMTNMVLDIGGNADFLKSIRVDLDLSVTPMSLRRIADIDLSRNEECRVARLLKIRKSFERTWGCEFSSVVSLEDHEGNLRVRCMSRNTEIATFFKWAWKHFGNEPQENVEFFFQ